LEVPILAMEFTSCANCATTNCRNQWHKQAAFSAFFLGSILGQTARKKTAEPLAIRHCGRSTKRA
jgi:hypothetical protein